MQQEKRTKSAQHAETRAALLREARIAFAERGYADTATEDVVARAGVTRGALYYHFTDKAGLFEAVLEVVLLEIYGRIKQSAEPVAGAFRSLQAGCRAYVDASLSPENRRIYLVDSTPVLGWARRDALDRRYCGGALMNGVQASLAEQPDPRLEAEPVVALLAGALEQAALHLAQAPEDLEARHRMFAAIDTLLIRLFRRGD